MNRDHAIDQRRKSAGARQLVIRRRAQHSQHIVEMPAPHGLDEREFVREILIKRTDADACHIGNSIGREAGPATLS